MARWPDIHPLAIAHLRTVLGMPPGGVATEVPGGDASKVGSMEWFVTEHGGFIRVARGPGSDDSVSDSFLLDVETFTGLTAGAGWTLAEDAREAMHDLAGAAVNGVLVDTVSTATAPVRVDYSPNVERYVASYRLNLRKRF
jgi:hypothetical protein